MKDLIRRITLGRHKNYVKADFSSGDTVEVSVRVVEGEKERVQVFKGVVIKVQGSGMGRSFTVRKISNGIGVERTFPFASPTIERVKIISRGSVRRSRLFYLRERKGKKARIEFELVRDQEWVASNDSDQPAEKTDA
jgi:large subunit ribosomal protein L19